MAVYAVGDVQGCYEALCRVLEQVGFDPARDRLWLVGDLINRGPQSLEVLRFVRSLGPAAQLVLGNHEVHLLAVAAGVRGILCDKPLATTLSETERIVGACRAGGVPLAFGLTRRWSRRWRALQGLIAEGVGDLGIVAGTVDTERLETYPFRSDRFVLVTPKEHTLAGRASVAFAEVLDHDFVGLDRASALVERIPGTRFRSQLYWFQSGLAIVRARYDEARRLLHEAHELHRRGRNYDADVLLFAGLATLAVDVGGLEELLGDIDSLLGASAYVRPTAESAAYLALELGAADLAERVLASPQARSPLVDDWTLLFAAAAALHSRVELANLERLAGHDSDLRHGGEHRRIRRGRRRRRAHQFGHQIEVSLRTHAENDRLRLVGHAEAWIGIYGRRHRRV